MASEEHTNEQEQEEQDTGEHRRSEAYEDARSRFDGLGTEEKAAFLVESIINTVADGLKEVSDQVSEAFRQACEKAEAEARKYQEASNEEAEVEVEDVDEAEEASEGDEKDA